MPTPEMDREYLAAIVLGRARPGQPRVVRSEDTKELLDLIDKFNKLASNLQNNPFNDGE